MLRRNPLATMGTRKEVNNAKQSLCTLRFAILQTNQYQIPQTLLLTGMLPGTQTQSPRGYPRVPNMPQTLQTHWDTQNHVLKTMPTQVPNHVRHQIRLLLRHNTPFPNHRTARHHRENPSHGHQGSKRLLTLPPPRPNPGIHPNTRISPPRPLALRLIRPNAQNVSWATHHNHALHAKLGPFPTMPPVSVVSGNLPGTFPPFHPPQAPKSILRPLALRLLRRKHPPRTFIPPRQPRIIRDSRGLPGHATILWGKMYKGDE